MLMGFAAVLPAGSLKRTRTDQIEAADFRDIHRVPY